MRITLLILVICLMTPACAAYADMDLFVWDVEDLDAELAAESGFTRVFLQYDSDMTLPELPTDMELCYLDGGPEWGAGDMIKLIQRAAEDGVSGVVLDCEGWYTKHSPTKEHFGEFIDQVSAAYQVANELNVKLGVCVPYWCEKVSRSELRRLVSDGCDELIVMDYNKRSLVKNISTEVRYCAEYGKQLRVALMISPDADIQDEDAYWAGGMDTLKGEFQKIWDAYGADIGFSIHHAKYLAEFLGQ